MEISEGKKWNASWIISALMSSVLAWVVTGTTLDMVHLFAIICIVWALAIALIWVLTPRQRHRRLKGALTFVLTVAAASAVLWVYSKDRPILRPQIEGAVTQNFNGDAFGLDVRTLVRNDGRQGSYADRWKLKLIVDGVEIDGKELFGQPLPPRAASGPEISDREFRPGAPVRGWLFFGFPGTSHDSLQSYFTCGSPLMDNVTLELSVWDSEHKREWTQAKALRDLGNEACTPLQIAHPTPAPNLEPQSPIRSTLKARAGAHTSQTSGALPGTQSLTAPSLPSPPQSVDHGIINNGSNSGSQTVEDNRQYGEPLPPPPIHFEQTQLAPIPQEPPSSDPAINRRNHIADAGQDLLDDKYPGVALTIVLDGGFYNPAFIIQCSAACHLKLGSIGTTSTDSVQIQFLSSSDLTIQGVRFVSPQQMQSGTKIFMQLRSLDSSQITVTSAGPYVQPIQ